MLKGQGNEIFSLRVFNSSGVFFKGECVKIQDGPKKCLTCEYFKEFPNGLIDYKARDQ